MEEPSETLKGVVLACGRAAVSIVNAGTAMGKGSESSVRYMCAVLNFRYSRRDPKHLQSLSLFRKVK